MTAMIGIFSRCDLLTKVFYRMQSNKSKLMLYIPYSKNIGGKKSLANYSNLPSFFANFDYFYNIPYANGIQFIKVFPTKLLTVLSHQTFYHQSLLLYGKLLL